MNSIRNDLDAGVNSPPSQPRYAWSGPENTHHAQVSRIVSDQAGSSSRDDVQTTEARQSSFEIVNEFGSTYHAITPTGRAMNLPYSRDLDASSRLSEDSLVSPMTPTTPSGPVPVPRKRTNSLASSQLSPRPLQLEIENKRLVQKIEELQQQNAQTESELLNWKHKTEELEATQTHVLTSTDRLTQQLFETTIQSPVPYDSLSELSLLREELRLRTAEVSRLEVEKRELERKLSAVTIESLDASITGIGTRTGTKPNKRIEVRLEETLQSLKAKEQEISGLQEQLYEKDSKVSEELARTKAMLERATKEKADLHQNQLSSAVQQKQELEVQLERLSEDLVSTQSQLSDLETKYSLNCQELIKCKRDSEAQYKELRDQISAKQDELENYKESHLASKQEDSHIIEQLTEANTSLLDQLESMKNERDTKQSEGYRELFDRYSQTIRELQQLKGVRQQETATMKQVLDEIKKEAGDTLGDYNATVVQLEEAERQRDEFRRKYEDSLNILASRNQELGAANAQLRECETRWQERLEKSLKKERKEYETNLAVSKAQMATYQEDFAEERKAREKMAGEKFQMEAAIKLKNEEIAQLRRRLNEQAVQAMQDDLVQSEYSHESPPLRAQDPGHSPYQYHDPYQDQGHHAHDF